MTKAPYKAASAPVFNGLYKKRRGVELFLLFISLSVGVLGGLMVNIESPNPLGSSFLISLGALILLVLVVHVIISIRAPYADPTFLPLAAGLNSIGLTMIYRIDLTSGNDDFRRQFILTFVAIIIAAFVIHALKDPRILRRITYISLVLSLIFLLMPMIPHLGVEIYGARLWIQIPGLGSFQPGEIAKVTLAIFYAGYLSTNRDLILLAGKKVGGIQFPRFKDMAPMFVAWILSIGILVFQKDLGTAILLFGMFVAMIYIATSRASWILIGLTLVALGGFASYYLIDHVHARIDGWLNALTVESYTTAFGGSMQIIQGIFGMREGGLFGVGLTQGRPDLVPMSNSDMIIAALGEEIGLAGLFAIMCFYVLLVSRGLRTALSAPDNFSKVLASGLSFIFVIQVFVVIGGITRLIPLTGLTTPFLAAGGSSLLISWVIIALFIRISHQARQPVSTNAPLSSELDYLNQNIDADNSALEATVQADDITEDNIDVNEIMNEQILSSREDPQ